MNRFKATVKITDSGIRYFDLCRLRFLFQITPLAVKLIQDAVNMLTAKSASTVDDKGKNKSKVKKHAIKSLFTVRDSHVLRF